ncbi:hypothetical protein [Anatilimnocola floriformis]|uniref:hypothetical protein n=1 Tax=Anatilimnocola floriformis TaxID=2948575 RepID=UPI0020C5482B|nr:hypothetical protein [Anatilimnocola floriformis]
MRIAIGIAILAALCWLSWVYIRSYYALVIPEGRLVADFSGPITVHAASQGWEVTCRCRLDHYTSNPQLCQLLFSPIEIYDREQRIPLWKDDRSQPTEEEAAAIVQFMQDNAPYNRPRYTFPPDAYREK